MLRGSSDIKGIDGVSCFSREENNQTGRLANRTGVLGYLARHYTPVKNLFARALSCFCPCVWPKSAVPELRRGIASNTRRTDKSNQKNQDITKQAAFQPAGAKLRHRLEAASITSDSQQGYKALKGAPLPFKALPKYPQDDNNLEGKNTSTFIDLVADKFIDDF